MVGFINAFQLSEREQFLRAAGRSWDFIERRLIDRRRGEWIRGVNRAGQPLAGQAKIGFWKCPYHNTRAALEVEARLGGDFRPDQP
jgi:mannobiose 2-epimerase